MRNFERISSETVRRVLKEVVVSMDEIFGSDLKNIILYGSYARNEHTSESDIDVMILVGLDEERLKSYEGQLTDVMVDLSLKYDVVLSLYAHSAEKYKSQVSVLPFLGNIQKEGIEVYG
ncbi:putative nucleotidyltransferase [Clostridium aceticum]|uniref:Putative nucleotidyltransferase n=1 Tax=Clostridium aceticum TaxID=84022 RepID=A0A0D8IEC1_9CLOT|nr:nucleotidyltransferase domain-containing protein [Clostridium aceticum]AKL93984.1 putative nucleotidyltransferase [Clostridium aceticum]KJF28633.1 hypothetical protein TZ02_01625 [Clostridium aceticum]